MYLGSNIRFLRKKRGWSQDYLAEKLGYKSYTTIQKWESGVAEPPLKTVHEIANLFCIDIDVLTKVNLESTQSDVWTVAFRNNLSEKLPFLDETDVKLYGLSMDRLTDIATGNVSLSFSEACDIADALGETLDVMVGRHKEIPTPAAEDGHKDKNIIKIAGRDGSFQERHLTDEQLAALKAILSQMPDASDYV